MCDQRLVSSSGDQQIGAVSKIMAPVVRFEPHFKLQFENESLFMYLMDDGRLETKLLHAKGRISQKRRTSYSEIDKGQPARRSQQHFVYSLAAALTLGFALPVAITGLLSQIGYLTYVVPWLRQLKSLPSWALATIQGILPLAILSLITAMVPSILRLLANMQRLHSRQGVENYVQIYYFSFLFVQVFLTVSLSAGITTIIGQVPDTVEAIPTLLAQNLPKASIISSLDERTEPRTTKMGTFGPVFTNMACIGLIYSVIAPLILVFSMIYFGTLWVLYRFYPPKLSDMELGASGLCYPTAIRQLMTGIYFMELCLAGLFFLVRDADGNATCTAQAIIMIVTMAFTALFHFSLDHKSGLHWLSSRPIFRQLTAQTGSKGKDMRVATKIFQSPCQDETLTSGPPVLWIPRDELGVAEDEIVHTRKTYNSIGISCDGASLNAQGKLILAGQPPGWRLK
ncbi:hypothetical protein O988_01543 [Pseudogymnoascus sp. VKM F-3808]|nr:hypothetical protein O988_01543 [Pseudogymnoascus sp. VKM F-3808]